MYQKNFITVDPGKSGGVAWSNNNGKVYAANCPANDEVKILELVRVIREDCNFRKATVVIEKLNQNAIDTPTTAWALSGNYHMWGMVFAGFKVPRVYRLPRYWQQKTGVKLPPGLENYKKRKKLLKGYAIEGFPDGLLVYRWSEKDDGFKCVKGRVTDANGDALAMLRALGTLI